MNSNNFYYGDKSPMFISIIFKLKIIKCGGGGQEGQGGQGREARHGTNHVSAEEFCG